MAAAMAEPQSKSSDAETSTEAQGSKARAEATAPSYCVMVLEEETGTFQMIGEGESAPGKSEATKRREALEAAVKGTPFAPEGGRFLVYPAAGAEEIERIVEIKPVATYA